MADHSQPDDAASSLRAQLDNIGMQQQETPISPMHPKRTPTESTRQASPQHPPPPPTGGRNSGESTHLRDVALVSQISPSSGARVRFSNDAMRPGRLSRLFGATQMAELYTIESNVDDGEGRWRGPGANGEASSSRGHSDGSSTYEPVSLTKPRHHFGGLDDNLKRFRETSTALAYYRDWATKQRERKRRWMNRPVVGLKTRARQLYKHLIVEGLLRQKPIPRSADGRHILLNPELVRRKPLRDERTGKPYATNLIRSTRYTLYDFVPKQLFFQFSKLANFYFLIIGLLQMIPGLSTTGTYTTIAPLIIFVCISMGKEGYDDYRRYQLDTLENKSITWVLDPGKTTNRSKRGKRKRDTIRKMTRRRAANAEAGMMELEQVTSSDEEELEAWSKVAWKDVRVGDVIRFRRDENVPADIVLLSATGPNGVAFIETMALDGETNLKSKQASPLLAKHCGSVEQMCSSNVVVVSEDPNLDLYNYEGRVSVGAKTEALTINQVVYRGSTLRNTSQAIGMVINTGEECKIRMNAHKNVHAKAPEMQAIANRIVALLVFFVAFLSIGCTGANISWRSSYEDKAFYINEATVPVKQILIGFVIMFNTLIPLSLYVSLEIVKLGQLYLLHDVEMYDPVSDTAMAANTTTILENLGQVSYVFSDKTGTLTENLMRFRKMSVAGTAWLHDMDIKKEAEERKQRRRSKQSHRHKDKTKARRSSQASVAKPQMQLPQDNAEALERPLVYKQQTHAQGPPPREPIPQWKSSARLAKAQPALNTEDLMTYLRRKPNTAFAKKARHFVLCMALCHTCLPEMDEHGEIDFQAASPDELALVQAAKDLGCLLLDRPAQSIKLQMCDEDGLPKVDEYQVLDVIEFSSKRKRMSIIIRMPDRRLCLFTKGADSVILPRLKHHQLAMQAASVVERRASLRRSVEQEKALRRSVTSIRRESLGLARAATTLSQRRTSTRKGRSERSMEARRSSTMLTNEIDSWLARRETSPVDQNGSPIEAVYSPRQSTARRTSMELPQSSPDDPYDRFVDETLALDDSAVFERCFHHIEDFASEGLRTLMFAYRYLGQDDYTAWKSIYHQATTSLENRQQRIEDAAELIEQDLELAGASAIEDKLQQGVPETVDKLRRAGIHVWMLTGDKRETAINIAHSARICKPYSEIYVLDASEGCLQEKLAATLVDVGRGLVPHSVVVIDGQTLSIVENDESTKQLLFDLVVRVDAVVCCRASPAQKATLVKCVRKQVPKAVTLAIGDGANDIAMIQASHVGIGISGREGLQAARISDYSIAQFRFLQRLLFVHGRWNYIRTGKYILATFWKELLFYLIQVQYQKYNGYTGTSLFEPTSLTVFNTLFTSLPVIVVGILDKDLAAATLLAVPELYRFGQKNKGFNYFQWVAWMILATLESVIIFSAIYGVYMWATHPVDASLYAIGDLAFTVSVVFINVKLLMLDMHHRNVVSFGAWLISVGGWFAWNLFLSGIMAGKLGPYAVRGSFLHRFGRNGVWWLTGFSILAAVIIFELVVASARRFFWPTDQDLMQEIENLPGVLEIMGEHALDLGVAERGEMAALTATMASNIAVFENGKTRTDHVKAMDKTVRDSTDREKRTSRHMSGEPRVPPPFMPLAEEQEQGSQKSGGKPKLRPIATACPAAPKTTTAKQTRNVACVMSPVEMTDLDLTRAAEELGS